LILLISASQVTRITGMSHWHQAVFCIFQSSVSLTSPGWPWTYNPLASASPVLLFQACCHYV
jgi:hypothetical protein